MLRAPTRALAALLILALLARGGWWAVDYFRFDGARISQLLTTADLSIASAAELPPGTGVDHQLTLAQAALDDAARRGAPLSSLMDRQQAIDTARDTAAGIVRLTQLTRIGGLPPELAGQPLRLARRADRLFLVAGGFYEVDTANQRLALLLAPGQTISDLTVGALQSVAWEHDAIRVQDGMHLFTLSDEGLWTGEPLGLGGSQQAWGPLPSGSFAGNFYLLDPTAGQVLRFPAGEMGSRPTAWVDPNDATGIDSAIDMTIDGEIHLLLADGTVLSYYRGEATAHLAIPVLPPVRTPLSLYGGPDTGYLYLADSDGASGRITRFDREGAQIHQLLLPNSNPGQNVVTPDPLSQLGDFVVDESTNSIYFVTNDALWEATIG